MDPVDVVLEVVRRFELGEAVGELFAPGYEIIGTPSPAMPLPRTADGDERAAAMRGGGLDAHVRGVVAGKDGRVLVRSVWTSRGPSGGGSAFLVHSVMTVRDERIVETRYLATQDEAERFAGIDRQSDPGDAGARSALTSRDASADPVDRVPPASAERRPDRLRPRGAGGRGPGRPGVGERCLRASAALQRRRAGRRRVRPGLQGPPADRQPDLR